MGGIGSGNFYRWDKKATCEAQHRVDVRFMHKQGWLYDGAYGRLSWTCRGEPSGYINYQIKEGTLILRYKQRRHRYAEWEPVDQYISILYTPCNYGGKRPWWQCPHCNRRVAVLYGVRKFFLCRHCYNLAYASQQEDKIDRLARKSDKIKERLGGRVGLFEWIPTRRPKGMHRRTYQRLYSQANDAQQEALALASRKFGVSRYELEV